MKDRDIDSNFVIPSIGKFKVVETPSDSWGCMLCDLRGRCVSIPILGPCSPVSRKDGKNVYFKAMK